MVMTGYCNIVVLVRKDVSVIFSRDNIKLLASYLAVSALKGSVLHRLAKQKQVNGRPNRSGTITEQ